MQPAFLFSRGVIFKVEVTVCLLTLTYNSHNLVYVRLLGARFFIHIGVMSSPEQSPRNAGKSGPV